MIDKHLPRLCLSLLLATGTALAQPAAAPLAFEVATVRPSAPLDMAKARVGQAHIGTRIDASRVDIGTATLFRLICTAYRVRPYQVSGPDWLKTTTYDIQAKIPDGVSADKVPEMLQTLLAERFGLKLHPENKDQSVYALVIGPAGPGGIKMKESAPEQPPPPPAPDAPKPQEMSMPTVQGDVKLVRTEKGASIEMPGGEIPGKIRVSVNPPAGSQPPRFHLESSGTTMKSFAEMLSVGVVGRPVVDMTGLTGAYEVAVDISMDDAMNVARTSISLLPTGGGGGDGGGGKDGAAGANLADPSGSSIFASIQNLGLKLEPRKLPLELLVIDHMEKTPTAN
jgi:uncharacterized protein (TIGR03435 family)